MGHVECNQELENLRREVDELRRLREEDAKRRREDAVKRDEARELAGALGRCVARQETTIADLEALGKLLSRYYLGHTHCMEAAVVRGALLREARRLRLLEE